MSRIIKYKILIILYILSYYTEYIYNIILCYIIIVHHIISQISKYIFYSFSIKDCIIQLEWIII